MTGKNVLLVEGSDDEHVVMHVCGHHGLPKIDEIAPLGGIDELLRDFPVRLKASDAHAVGAVVDADTDLDARWTSFERRLAAFGVRPCGLHFESSTCHKACPRRPAVFRNSP